MRQMWGSVGDLLLMGAQYFLIFWRKVKLNKESPLLGVLLILLATAGLIWAGSDGGVTWNGVPVYALAVLLAFVLNWLAFIPAWLRHTEKFFDLMGGISFVSVMTFAVFLSKPGVHGWLLFGLVLIWALRLSLFLFTRIRKAGADARFDEIKFSFSRFLLTWTLQGAWVVFSLAAALAAITGGKDLPFDAWTWSGLFLWLFGFIVEVVADVQKSRFRADPSNRGKFIRSGLWAWSRHPNYFGEIVLWIGIALIALPTLEGLRWLTLVSPLFVILLLTRVSGIPLLEARADARWGGQAEYEAYKRNTPVLIPRRPRR